MNIKELIAKYNADEVAGRLMVRIDGRNEFMATYDDSGFQLTAVGKALEAGTLRADGQVDEAPKARKMKVKKDAAVEENQLGDAAALDDLLADE